MTLLKPKPNYRVHFFRGSRQVSLRRLYIVNLDRFCASLDQLLVKHSFTKAEIYFSGTETLRSTVSPALSWKRKAGEAKQGFYLGDFYLGANLAQAERSLVRQGLCDQEASALIQQYRTR